jgi:hypothetical protein
VASLEIRSGVTVVYDDYCFVEPWTSPQTIVAVHGNAESARAWVRWVPLLAGQYRLVLPDMPGFGRSPAPAVYHWEVTEIAADLGRFLDAAKIGRCHLMGAKYGGSVVTQFASCSIKGRIAGQLSFKVDYRTSSATGTSWRCFSCQDNDARRVSASLSAIERFDAQDGR